MEVARGIKKPSWLFAEDLTILIKDNFKSYNSRLGLGEKSELSESTHWFDSHVTPFDNFFAIYTANLSNETHVLR